MAEQVSRRNFFKLLGGAAALAAAPTTVIAEAIEIPVEFGWTWHVPTDKIEPDSEFAKIIKKTLKDNAHKIRENISQNNALFLKLKDGRKAKLNIEHISPEEQTNRMAERLKKSREYTPTEHWRIRVAKAKEQLAWAAANTEELHEIE